MAYCYLLSCLSRFKSQGIIMCGLITESSPSPPAPSLTPHPLPWGTSRGKPSCLIQTGTRAITMMDPILKWAWSWPGLWLLVYCMALCGCYYHTFFVKSLQCNYPVRIFTWTSGHKNSLICKRSCTSLYCFILALILPSSICGIWYYRD